MLSESTKLARRQTSTRAVSIFESINMRLIVLLSVLIAVNSVSLSDSAFCQCDCCLSEPGNDDCQVNPVGIVTVEACPVDTSTLCLEKCKEQYPAQCNQNNSVVGGVCASQVSTTSIPSTTSDLNGPVECKCSCCANTTCEAIHQGNVIVDRCTECQQACVDKYAAQCGSASPLISIECGPFHSNHTSRLRLDLILFFLFTAVRQAFP